MILAQSLGGFCSPPPNHGEAGVCSATPALFSVNTLKTVSDSLTLRQQQTLDFLCGTWKVFWK